MIYKEACGLQWLYFSPSSALPYLIRFPLIWSGKDRVSNSEDGSIFTPVRFHSETDKGQM